MRTCRIAVTVTALVAVTACGADSSADPELTAQAETTALGTEESNEPDTQGGEGESAPEFDWQGHRGARGLRPENTLPGFELALDLTVDTLELDLHFSADGVAVVWHDPVIEPEKCEGDGVSVPVRELTAAQLRALRCDNNPDIGRFPDQRADSGPVAGADYGIVSLSELFAFVADYATSETKTAAQRANAETVRFNIETKRRPDDPTAIGDGFEPPQAGPFELAVLSAVTHADVAGRTTVQSFDHRSLWAVRAENQAVGLAALTRRTDAVDLDALAAEGADTWSPDHRAVTADLIAAAKAAGLRVVPWTINDPEDMADLIDLGVDGIITDRPDLRPSEP